MATEPKRRTFFRQRLPLLLAASLCLLSGCFGVTHNPSYFPHLFPFGDIIRTHGKPPGYGYWSQFRQACRSHRMPAHRGDQSGQTPSTS